MSAALLYSLLNMSAEPQHNLLQLALQEYVSAHLDSALLVLDLPCRTVLGAAGCKSCDDAAVCPMHIERCCMRRCCAPPMLRMIRWTPSFRQRAFLWGERITFEGFSNEPDAQLNPKKNVFGKLAPDLQTNAGEPAFMPCMYSYHE